MQPLELNVHIINLKLNLLFGNPTIFGFLSTQAQLFDQFVHPLMLRRFHLKYNAQCIEAYWNFNP